MHVAMELWWVNIDRTCPSQAPAFLLQLPQIEYWPLDIILGALGIFGATGRLLPRLSGSRIHSRTIQSSSCYQPSAMPGVAISKIVAPQLWHTPFDWWYLSC